MRDRRGAQHTASAPTFYREQPLDRELLAEKISHLETRISLWAAQHQLLQMLENNANAELASLRKQLAEPVIPASDPPAAAQ